MVWREKAQILLLPLIFFQHKKQVVNPLQVHSFFPLCQFLLGKYGIRIVHIYYSQQHKYVQSISESKPPMLKRVVIEITFSC
ncbi:hypothetical protein FR991_19090 [Bacteroides fragilis]|nr:hypothetical protein F2841_20420 [Bacteroides fragilis]KAA4773972.1 hypothetical protein F3B22_19155 [Bacteroides fragilis]KAA4784859.1 hypothetical protein F3B21_20495 [Bacteroides fragilis]KAA4787717.1 hypothetical protein F2047_19435 [Bacteroides fragilis]RGZ84611.1 hypothetical protein DW968_13510 [Bacteroides fragilis]